MSTPGAGGFQVKLQETAQAITELAAARDELMAIREEARDLAQITSPSADEVSRDAAMALGLKAEGSPGSFIGALSAGITQIESTIAGLQESLAAYRRDDETAASSFR